MPSFLVVTTRDLPEAYFLARFLEGRGQRLGILNITGRPPLVALQVLRRLARNRGWPYVIDLLAARAVHALGGGEAETAFRDVDRDTIARLKERWPRHEHPDPHAPETLAFVAGFAPDWILLAGAPVLQPVLYEQARAGALNRHLGVLPAYRGSDCPLWALAADAPEDVGFSIHFVTERVDAGDVVLRRPVPLPPATTLDVYLGMVQRQASEAFIEVLDRIIRGLPLPRQSQPGGGRYFPPAPLSIRRRARRNVRRRAGVAPHPEEWRLDRPAGGRRPVSRPSPG